MKDQPSNPVPAGTTEAYWKAMNGSRGDAPSPSKRWMGPGWLLPERNGRGEIIGTHFRSDKPTAEDPSKHHHDQKGPRGLTMQWPFPESAGTSPDCPIIVCEGGSDAVAVLGVGLDAIGVPMAGSGAEYVAERVRGRHVAICRDNDNPGRLGAAKVAAALAGVCASVRVFAPPPEHKDARAWIVAGAMADDFLDAILAADPEGKADSPAEARAEGWDDLVPLEDGPPPPAFPVDALLPVAARRAVESVATAFAVPVDLPALAWLALAGGCVSYAGAGCRVVRAGPDWTETTNLYAAVALPSGTRKSHTFAWLTGPVLDFERDLVAAAKPEVAIRQAERTVREGTLRKAQTQASSGDRAAEDEARRLAADLAIETPPVLPRLLCEDTSPERLTSLLAEQSGRMILASAECDIIGTLKGRYSDKGGTNLGVFLKGHSGEPLIVDRIGRPADRVERATLTMLICCQPGALSSLLVDPVLEDRGVVNRFLYAVPLSPLGYRDLRPPPVPGAVEAEYREMMLRALRWDGSPPWPPQLDEPTLAGGSGGREPWAPRHVALDAAAVAALDGFRGWIERALRPGEELAPLCGWAAKLPGAVVRIAGIMALMDDPDRTEIGAEYLERAVRIGSWAVAHARRAFAAGGADPSWERAKLLAGWIKRKRPPTFTKRGAWQALKGSGHVLIARAADLDGALDILADHGWIMATDPREREPRRGGRNPSTIYAVHPQISMAP